MRYYAGTVVVKAEFIAYGPGGLAYVDTQKSSAFKYAETFVPYLVEFGVHQLERPHRRVRQAFGDFLIHRGECSVPHLDHRIGRRGDNQVYGTGGEHLHPLCVAEYYSVSGVHQLPKCSRIYGASAANIVKLTQHSHGFWEK